MPVTANLLQRLRETLGDEATNDLFSWWEGTAMMNRVAIRGEFRAALATGLAEVRVEFKSELAKGLADVRSEIAELRAEMASQRADLIKWMFIFWAGTVIPLGGLAVALTKL